jgi:hypothetical protein
MKYSTTIALFVGLVAADYKDCQPCADSLCIKNENDYGVGDNGCGTQAPLGGSSSLKALGDHFLGQRGDCAENTADAYGVGFTNENSRHQKIIDDDASSVKAHYESCHVGERIIPAIKEESHIQ